MKTLAFVTLNGMTKDHYEQLRKTVKWDVNQPKGLVFHAAAFDKNGCKVADVWESEADFKGFIDTRLAPAMQKLPIKVDVKSEIIPLHALFAPGLTK
ncbi:MAG TPA: hypothetical protein VN285_12300 [Candidatus Deferrimicrobium sp.]|nr:hypothetical protein [Candidatus Deferrimicrobium sp.]